MGFRDFVERLARVQEESYKREVAHEGAINEVDYDQGRASADTKADIPDEPEREKQPQPALGPDPKEEGEAEATPGKAEHPAKQYLGSKGDEFYYFVTDKGDAGQSTDRRILDAEEKSVFSAKEAELSEVDDVEFIKQAVTKLGLDVISVDVLNRYDLMGIKAMDAEKKEDAENKETAAPTDDGPTDAEDKSKKQKAQQDEGPNESRKVREGTMESGIRVKHMGGIGGGPG